MAVNKYLLNIAKQAVKQAFVPPQGGAAPPMDPSMMGGAPPGGAPPMDPSMMGGMPPGGAPPMDPSMMGGAPPADPTADIRAVVQEEIQKAMGGAKGGGRSSKKNDNGQVELYMHRIQKLLTHLYSSLGLNLPHDILDDITPQKGGDDQAAQPSQDVAPVKAAEVSVAEKAAGMMYLLRKQK